MLVGFLGAPNSGKTTAALSITAQLKLDHYVAEYLPEKARHAIKRINQKLNHA